MESQQPKTEPQPRVSTAVMKSPEFIPSEAEGLNHRGFRCLGEGR